MRASLTFWRFEKKQTVREKFNLYKSWQQKLVGQRRHKNKSKR